LRKRRVLSDSDLVATRLLGTGKRGDRLSKDDRRQHRRRVPMTLLFSSRLSLQFTIALVTIALALAFPPLSTAQTDETRSEQTQAEGTQTEAAPIEDTLVETAQPGDTQSEQTQAEATQTEAESTEDKPVFTEEPGNAQPEETRPEEIQPQETPAGEGEASAITDTIYVPDLVEPDIERDAESEILLGEGPDIEVRFGRTLKTFMLTDENGQSDFAAGMTASYDRVDGFSLFLHQEFSHFDRLYPRVHIFEGYSFASKDWRYRLDFEQPLFSQESFSFGGSIYLITDHYDEEIMGNVENSLSTFFFKWDYRDYLEKEGWSIFAKQKFGGYHTATLQYAEEIQRSLGVETRGVFYRDCRDFRENPPVDEGKWAISTFAYEFDSREEEDVSWNQYWHRLRFERGHNKDVPDSEYDMFTADVRTYLDLSPGQHIRTRIQYGATPSGTLPLQKEFAVGGIGTLRAHSYQEYSGDHMLLFNVEYLIDLMKRFQLILLADAGKAWYGKDALKDQALELDVGIGIGREEGLRLCVARTPSEEGGGLAWTLRLQRPF
jgi:hypothetical protein